MWTKTTHKLHLSAFNHFPLTLNQQWTALKQQEQHHWVMHWNQTQHSRLSIYTVNTKETTRCIHQQPTLFRSYQKINREPHWRHRGNIIEWRIENKCKTHKTQSIQWTQKKQPANSIHQQSTLFPFFPMETIGCEFGDSGASSLSDALKVNFSLVRINLKGERERMHKQYKFLSCFNIY